jgi:two-component system response regulator YesN
MTSPPLYRDIQTVSITRLALGANWLKLLFPDFFPRIMREIGPQHRVKYRSMANQILLVDDDQVLRAEFKEYFGEYDVLEAADGTTALAILNKPHEIDLIILDIRLPGMSGLELLHRIKQQSPEIGIIIQTGYGSKDMAIEALRGKADDFLEKPFDPEKARKLIEHYFSATPSSPGENVTQAEEIIQRITAYIQRNYLKKITLKDISNVVFLSPKYLSRIFKEQLKISFCDFKLLQKINKAKELLLTTNDNIDAISSKIGYQNTESFIRIFKKMAGTTPTEFRRKHKSQKKVALRNG